MKIFHRLLAAAALALLAISFAPTASFANGTVMCAPETASGSAGPRRFVNPNSNNAYGLNSAGCAYIAQTDVGYAQSQGFTFGPNTGTIIYTTGVQTGTTDIVIGNLPPNAYVISMGVTNATANAVTGGISLGSTANGTQFVAAQTCAANCVSAGPAIAATVYSTTAPVALHAAAVTAWNSANVTITVTYGYF